MDHKVSKDMISSGMIPSGEKTQADLGRIQYGSAPSPSSLMDAYKSIYEHHQKDKDGNTIPHEGEELNETLMGAVAKGLRGASKVSKNLATSAAKADKSIKAQGGLKNIAQKKLQSAKTKLAPTSGQKQALLGRTTAGKITRGVAALGAANIAGRMSQDKPSGGYSSYDINFGYTPEGDTISEDLFDSLKSALIEEGCDEKSAMKIMSSITPEFINETIQEENLDEFVVTGTIAALLAKKALAGAALKTAGKLAAKSIAKKGVIGAAKAGAKAFGAGVKKGALKTTTKKITGLAGAGQKTGAAARGLGAAAKNNPVNTALLATSAPSMLPQKAPTPPPDPRATMSGKRTAGTPALRKMDLDLFDIVKGQLLDEGLTKEEVLDVMTTLTIDEIKEGLMPTTLKGALVRGAVGAAGGVLAKKGLDKAKEASNDAINKARDSLKGFGGNTRPGSDKMYFGK